MQDTQIRLTKVINSRQASATLIKIKMLLKLASKSNARVMAAGNQSFNVSPSGWLVEIMEAIFWCQKTREGENKLESCAKGEGENVQLCWASPDY